MNGKIEIIIRGRPSPKVFPRFAELVQNSPYISYKGEYSHADLAAIYKEVHFCWAINYYQAGLNSAWLLPNRIYESSFFGAVSIALMGVETANWLKSHGSGVVLDEPIGLRLKEFFKDLSAEAYAEEAASLGRIPISDVVDTRENCRALVEACDRYRSVREDHAMTLRSETKDC